jgi:hypothetical protein
LREEQVAAHLDQTELLREQAAANEEQMVPFRPRRPAPWARRPRASLVFLGWLVCVSSLSE